MKTAKQKRPRPKFPPISEDMKQWSAMLREELSKWPKITSRPMFGCLGFYRGRKIFAALPVTRGFNSPNSLIFRINPMPPDLARRVAQESRIASDSKRPGAKWFVFEVNSPDDLRDVLWWLNQAYERAK